MKLVRLVDAAESHTPLGAFVGARMRGFNPEKYMMAIGQLERNLAYIYKGKRTQIKRRRRYAIQHLKELRQQAMRSGLTIVPASCKASIDALKDPYYGVGRHLPLDQHVEAICGATRRLLEFEMQQLVYFEIPAADLVYWRDRNPFGPVVRKKFPLARDHIEHASKCIATDRASAAVFHLMCAIDIALQRFAKRLKVKVNFNMSWFKILEKIEVNIKKLPHDTNRRKTRIARYRELALLIDRIREAWRNETMHTRKIYEPNDAREIFEACKQFMGRAARVL